MRILFPFVCFAILLQGCIGKCPVGIPPAHPVCIYIIDSHHQFSVGNLNLFYVGEGKAHSTQGIIYYPTYGKNTGNPKQDTTKPYLSFFSMLREPPNADPRDWYLDYQNGQVDTLTFFMHDLTGGSGHCATTDRYIDSIRYRGALLPDTAVFGAENPSVFVLNRD